MKIRRGILSLVALSALLLGSTVFVGCDKKDSAPVKVAKGVNNEQIICPITQKPIDKQLFADKNGKRIYAADQQSLRIIQGDFERTAKQMESVGIVLAKTQ